MDLGSSRPLIDKLGVTPGMRVAVLGAIDEPDFWSAVRERTMTLSLDEAVEGVAMIIVLVEQAAGLGQLPDLRARIASNGAIWVVWPKLSPRQPRLISEDDIRAAALAVGLVDTKVVRFSDRLSALKLVIPVAQRPPDSRARPRGRRATPHG